MPHINEAITKSAVLANGYDLQHPQEAADFEIANMDGLDQDERFDEAMLKKLCEPK